MHRLALLFLVLIISLLAGCQANPIDMESRPQNHSAIAVHGDWIIEVRNPDGSLVQKSGFANQLIWEGSSVLASLLFGDVKVENHGVLFLGLLTKDDKFHLSPGGGWGCENADYDLASKLGVGGSQSKMFALASRKQVLEDEPISETSSRRYNKLVLTAGCTVFVEDPDPQLTMQLTALVTMLGFDKTLRISETESANHGRLTVKSFDNCEPDNDIWEGCLKVIDGQMMTATVVISFTSAE